MLNLWNTPLPSSSLGIFFSGSYLFLLVFARLIGIFVQAPLFGRPRGIPMQVQIGYALGISLIMFHVVPMPKTFPQNILLSSINVAGQVVIGLMIGFASYMVAAGVQFAGELVDIQMGVSIAASFDPSMGGTVNMMRQFEFRLALLIWIFIHGDYFFFKAVERSYEIIPLTSFVINGQVIYKLISMTGGVFLMGLEIAAPVLGALFITHVALGMLNHASRQFNVFMISFPLNILVGLSLLILSLPPLLLYAMPNLWHNSSIDLMQVIMALRRR